jgi:hypothetical protein
MVRSLSRGNCVRGSVLKANVQIGPLFSTLQDRTCFFKTKQAAAPIPLGGLNGVQFQWKRRLYPCFVIARMTCFENSKYNDTFGF